MVCDPCCIAHAGRGGELAGNHSAVPSRCRHDRRDRGLTGPRGEIRPRHVVLAQFALNERRERVVAYHGEQVTVATEMRKSDRRIGGRPSHSHRKCLCPCLGI